MTLPQVSIRPVRLSDADDIHAARIQPEASRFTSSFPGERVTKVQAFLEGLTPHDVMLVAEVGGHVVGVCGLHGHVGKARHVATLGLLVHDAFAHRGIGRALCENILDIADRHLGLVRVELDVNTENARAIRLYEMLGFEREGLRRRAYFTDGKYADAIAMARLRGI